MTFKARIIELVGTFFLFLVIGMNSLLPNISSTACFSIAGVLILLVYMGGSISGAQYNPSVSLGIWIRKNGSINELLSYMLSQFSGIILALAPLYFLVEVGGVSENGFMPAQIFAAEFIFTFLLVFTVLMVATNPKVEGNSFYGIAIGLVVFVGICVVGGISGAVFNPAVLLGLSVIRIINLDQIPYYLFAEILAALTAGNLAKYILED